jgi:hypothetical protein
LPLPATYRAETRVRSSIVDLQDLRAHNLDRLVDDQTAEWRQELDWDFSKSAGLVRRLADQSSLRGAAVVNLDEVTGYAYASFEDTTGLISDLYVRPASRDAKTEALLFRILLDALTRAPAVNRVEGQFMLCSAAAIGALRSHPGLRFFERILMKMHVRDPLPHGGTSTVERFRIEHGTRHSVEPHPR